MPKKKTAAKPAASSPYTKTKRKAAGRVVSARAGHPGVNYVRVKVADKMVFRKAAGVKTAAKKKTMRGGGGQEPGMIGVPRGYAGQKTDARGPLHWLPKSRGTASSEPDFTYTPPNGFLTMNGKPVEHPPREPERWSFMDKIKGIGRQ